MKKIKLDLLIMLLCIMGISQTALAVNESEPNDLWNQADVITLGATGNGGFSPAGESDWWRVNSAAEGKLTVNFSSLNGQFVYCEVADTLGVVFLSSGVYTSGSTVVNVDGLAAGTYYIRFRPYYSYETTTYSFTPSWTIPAQAIDVEPNGTKNQAKTLPLNNTKTGHIGYYFNNYRDSLDWWKVTTTADGKLKWTITSHNGQNVYAELFDNNGTIYLGGNYTSGTASFTADGLAAGVYYIRIRCYYNTEFAPYTITDSLLLPPVNNDTEPNGTYPQALTINLDDTVRGHIGYYYNQQDDTLDWYKFTTTTEGKVNFTIYSLNSQNVYLELFDGNGTSYLAGSYSSSSTTFNKDGLAAGTYYFRLRTYYYSEFAPYKFVASIVTPIQTIDNEPNGTKATAKKINLNDSVTGHVGYANYLARDTMDYRKITLTSNGRLEWTITSGNGQNIFAQLYDNNATTFLAGSYTSGTATFTADGLAPGTYYLLLVTYYASEFVPYSLKTRFYAAGNDPEPNGSYATAKPINLNDSLNGTIGYYYNASRDTNDWFALTTNNDGQLNITLYGLGPKCVFLDVYDKNGTTILYSQYTCGGVLSFSRNDLAKGTYYVHISCYYASQNVAYALVNNLVNNNPNDPEPNKYAKNGTVINGYSTRKGNIYYYYDGAKDTTDWWKLAYTTGNVSLTINKVQHTFDANYPDINYKLYKDTTAAPVDDQNLTGSAPFSFTYTTLTSGTYYIKITQLNNSFGGYSIKADYRDTTSHQVALVADLAGTVCGNGQLTYVITRGKAPYSVQLYKDGVASGSPLVTSDTAKFTLLDAGYYNATVRSSSAVTYTVTSSDTTVVPQPVGLTTSNKTTTSAILKWTGLPCVDGYKLQWRLKGTTGWANTIYQPAGATQDTITGLSAATQYQFRVFAYVNYIGSTKYYGLVSATKSFTTPAVRIDGNNQALVNEIDVYPNPVADKLNFIVDNASPVTSIKITNTIGQTVLLIEDISQINQLQVDVSMLNSGIYFVNIQTTTSQFTSRFIKE